MRVWTISLGSDWLSVSDLRDALACDGKLPQTDEDSGDRLAYLFVDDSGDNAGMSFCAECAQKRSQREAYSSLWLDWLPLEGLQLPCDGCWEYIAEA